MRSPTRRAAAARHTLLLIAAGAVIVAAAIASLWMLATPIPQPPALVAPTNRPSTVATQPWPAEPPPAEPTPYNPRNTHAPSDPPAPTPTPRPDPIEQFAQTPFTPQATTDQPTTAPAPRIDRSATSRRARLAEFGGTKRTEDAVEAGLAWLAAHQEPDGTWDRLGFQRHCPKDDICPGAAVRRTTQSFKPGLTGLCALAFLGAGYTDRVGPYQDVVRRAVAALLRAQNAAGGFGGEIHMAGYNNAVATFALAEYYALTREQLVRAPLERAVAHIVYAQQSEGGWDYIASPDAGRNDTSITGWTIQALQAAATAGIDVPGVVLARAALQYERARAADGRIRYSDAGSGFYLDQDTMRAVYRYSPALTAAGLATMQLLGWRSDSTAARQVAANLLTDLPSRARMQRGDPDDQQSYYGWYYGTLAMFQRGGAEWDRWNAGLRDALLPLQDRRGRNDGNRRHTYGSWPPMGSGWGRWGRLGSRIYVTALNVLTLEVYYRHSPAYLEQAPALANDWRKLIPVLSRREQRIAIDALRGMRIEIGEPVLVDLLQSPDLDIRILAADALLDFDSAHGLAVFRAARPAADQRSAAVLATRINRAEAIQAAVAPRGDVRKLDRQRRLATVMLDGAYVGLPLNLVDELGAIIGTARVIQRFQDAAACVVELDQLPERERTLHVVPRFD